MASLPTQMQAVVEVHERELAGLREEIRAALQENEKSMRRGTLPPLIAVRSAFAAVAVLIAAVAVLIAAVAVLIAAVAVLIAAVAVLIAAVAVLWPEGCNECRMYS